MIMLVKLLLFAKLNKQNTFLDIKEELNKLTKEEHKLKLEEIELQQKLKTVNASISEYKAQIHQWKAKVILLLTYCKHFTYLASFQISQLKLHDIPEESLKELQTYSADDLAHSNKSQQVQNELYAAEEQLKTAKPNLKVVEVRN